MARLFTTGFELALPGSQVPTGAGSVMLEDPLFQRSQASAGNGTSIETTIVRSGACSMKISNSTSTDEKWAYVFDGANPRTYFCRTCFYIGQFGNSNVWPLNLFGSTSQQGIEVMVTTAGVLTAAFASTDAQVVLGPTVVTGRWYVAEVSFNVGTGATQLWVDGVSYGTGTSETVGSDTNFHFAWGAVSNGTLTTWYYDDCAINDDQGTSQNGRVGNTGKVVFLKPVSDNGITGSFTAGAGSGSNLFAAVDNTPPVGVALASATNTSQIKDTASSATDNYKANLAPYTTAVASGGGGMGAFDNVVVAQGLCHHANSTTTTRTNGLQVVSNPAIAETQQGTGGAAAGTSPTGWNCLKTAVSYAPTVTLGTGPVLEFWKRTASTDAAMAQLMGMYVEYTPGSAPVGNPPIAGGTFVSAS